MEVSSKNLALKENLGSGLNKQVQEKKKKGTLTMHNKQIGIYQGGLPMDCEGEKGSQNGERAGDIGKDWLSILPWKGDDSNYIKGCLLLLLKWLLFDFF